MRRLLRPGGVLLVVVLAVAVELALEPSPSQSLAAMAELGPLDGWRCVHESALVYDPRWPRLPGGLLSEAPEQQLPGIPAERVEIDLATGEAVAWTRTAADKQRVYELAPGSVQTIASSCVGHLAGWHVISEHSLD